MQTREVDLSDLGVREEELKATYLLLACSAHNKLLSSAAPTESPSGGSRPGPPSSPTGGGRIGTTFVSSTGADKRASRLRTSTKARRNRSRMEEENRARGERRQDMLKGCGGLIGD